MEEVDFSVELEKIKKDDIPEIFELVKRAVQKVTGGRRAGMMLALADLGEGENYWIGGFHVLTSNAIVMNTRSLDYITEKHPNLLKYYIFEILMHEYLHTLGIKNEHLCRSQALEIAEQLFGKTHTVTQLARDIKKFLPYIRRAEPGFSPPRNTHLKYVRGFDRSSVSYIS